MKSSDYISDTSLSPATKSASIIPGVGPTEVRQSCFPATRGLQQVEAAVDVCSDPLWQDVGVLRGHGGQVQRAGGRVRLPGPDRKSTGSQHKCQKPVYPPPVAGCSVAYKPLPLNVSK